jgi:hypothetical protein
MKSHARLALASISLRFSFELRLRPVCSLHVGPRHLPCWCFGPVGDVCPDLVPRNLALLALLDILGILSILQKDTEW